MAQELKYKNSEILLDETSNQLLFEVAPIVEDIPYYIYLNNGNLKLIDSEDFSLIKQTGSTYTTYNFKIYDDMIYIIDSDRFGLSIYDTGLTYIDSIFSPTALQFNSVAVSNDFIFISTSSTLYKYNRSTLTSISSSIISIRSMDASENYLYTSDYGNNVIQYDFNFNIINSNSWTDTSTATQRLRYINNNVYVCALKKLHCFDSSLTTIGTFSGVSSQTINDVSEQGDNIIVAQNNYTYLLTTGLTILTNSAYLSPYYPKSISATPNNYCIGGEGNGVIKTRNLTDFSIIETGNDYGGSITSIYTIPK